MAWATGHSRGAGDGQGGCPGPQNPPNPLSYKVRRAGAEPSHAPHRNITPGGSEPSWALPASPRRIFHLPCTGRSGPRRLGAREKVPALQK